MKIIAKTFAGLEEVLAKEISDLGGNSVELKKRSVAYEGDLQLLYKSNYCLRTALKILVPICEFEFNNVDEYYKKIADIQWEKYFTVDKSIFIEPVVSSPFFTNTQFAALKAKDAIVDRMREKFDRRPDIDTKKPDININVYVRDNFCNISLDSSGEPLFKRGYRVKTGLAPINEVLAAGMILLSEWNKKTELLDFMCGSGTIPIEAVMIALNIPPQFKRKNFGFQNWINYDKKLFETTATEEYEKQSTDNVSVFASDILAEMIDFASENIANAGFSSYISLRKTNFMNLSFNSPKHIIFNPPYGKRIGSKEDKKIIDFYKSIGDVLKNNFKESKAWLISGNLLAVKHIGLKPSKKIILFNGPLESRFIKFEMY